MRRILLLVLAFPTAAAVPLTDLEAIEWEVASPGPVTLPPAGTAAYGLTLVVHPLRGFTSVPLTAVEDSGGSVVLDPPAVETRPGVERYRVNVTWRPGTFGNFTIVVDASGEKWTETLRVEPAPALLALSADAPAADWTIVLPVRHAADVPEDAPTTWAARWSDGNGTLAWEEPGPRLPFRPEDGEARPAFLLRYGPGRYEITLRAHGRWVAGESAPLALEAARATDPSSEVPIVAVVPDAPLTVALTSDTVNADGKLKRPGEELVTRVRLADGNGLAALARVTFEVLREGAVVNVTDSALPADRWARTTLDLESRFAASPMSAGPYTMRIRAWNDSGPAAAATRTFAIKAVRPDLANLTLEASSVLTDRAWTLAGSAALESKGWERPVDVDGLLQLRVYRGTTQVAWEAGAGNVTGPTPLLAPLAGAAHARSGAHGVATLPIAVTVPAGAAGSYRVNVLWSANATDIATSLASWTLVAEPAPAFTTLEAAGEPRAGSRLPVAFEVSEGALFENVTFSLLTESVNVPDRAGIVNLTVPPGLDTGSPLQLLAEVRAAGRVVSMRALDLEVANSPPEAILRAALDGVPMERLRILPGAAREVRAAIAASDANGDAPIVESLALVDWNGRVAAETSPIAREGGAEGVLDLPATLPPGAYRLVARVRDAEGATGEASLPALVGGWAGVRGYPTSLVVTGGMLVGTLRVENVGTVPIAALAADVDGAGPLSRAATLRLGAAASAEGAPLALGTPLAPGEAVELSVEVPLDPRDTPGRYAGTVRILAVPGGGSW